MNRLHTKFLYLHFKSNCTKKQKDRSISISMYRFRSHIFNAHVFASILTFKAEVAKNGRARYAITGPLLCIHKDEFVTFFFLNKAVWQYHHPYIEVYNRKLWDSLALAKGNNSSIV